MNLFLDTSAFAKRYVVEEETERVLALCDDADRLVVSVLCWPELVSALSRLVRERRLTRATAAKLKSRAIEDLRDVDVVQLTPDVVGAAVRLLERRPLRALDAIHVASALVVGNVHFVSADARQLESAKSVRVKVVDVRPRSSAD